MKKIAIAALLAAQLVSAAPARAADLIPSDMASSHRTGTFVGARLRVPLDGQRSAGERAAPRLTLAAAPALRSLASDGAARTRIGAGLEFGLQGEELRLDLAGRPVGRLVEGGSAPAGRRGNISTVGWVAIGVGVAAVTAFLLYGLCGSGEICDVEDD